MKRRSINLATASLAFAMAGAPLAWAQDHPNDAQHSPEHPGQQPPEHPGQHAAPVHPEHAPPRPAPRRPVVVNKTVVNKTVVNEHVDEHVTERGGPVGRPGEPVRPVVGPRWHHGDRFNGNRVVFVDYDRYHVRRPPPGYQWVQDGNELVLISIADGLIADTFFITIP